MPEDNSYEVADDRGPTVIVQQLRNEDLPDRLAEETLPETKDLAPPKSKRHHRHPTPEIAAITKRYSTELPSTDRHSRKCQICHHPDRASIEEDFLLWCTPRSIRMEYDICEMSLYRHALAFDLFTVRRESLRLGLDRIVERGAEAPVTGDMVIRAVKAQACLTEDNRWEEPAKHMIFSKSPEPDRFSGGRSFSSDINDSGEAANRCADSPAASSRVLGERQVAATGTAIPEGATGNVFHHSPATTYQSPVLIDSLPIRSEA